MKEEKDRLHREEQNRTSNLIEEKGKQFFGHDHSYCYRLAACSLFGLLVHLKSIRKYCTRRNLDYSRM